MAEAPPNFEDLHDVLKQDYSNPFLQKFVDQFRKLYYS